MVSMEQEETTIRFALRGRKGQVEVRRTTNEDPRRWGYHLLEGALGFPAAKAEGFPVVSARVRYDGEGYGAAMGWVQVVRMREVGSSEEHEIVDKPPQLADDGSPYCFWGSEPSFFDAPSTTARLELWSAHAFLVASPDAVMTREVRPVCGFSWGFSNAGTHPDADAVRQIGEKEWSVVCDVLARSYPEWSFGAWWHEGGHQAT
jgi:hypothetical protein